MCIRDRYTGIVTRANLLSRKLFSWAERLIASIPLVKNIYSTIKQITNAFSGAVKTDNYQRVIYIQYPRAELWTISFVTGESVDKSGVRYYYVFVPTTPNPTSGVFIIIPQKDAVDAEMTVEEGLKAVISGGLLAPKRSPIGS